MATTALQKIIPTVSSHSSLFTTERLTPSHNTAVDASEHLNVPFTYTESSGYVTSTEATEVDPATDPFFMPNKKIMVSTIATSTTISGFTSSSIPLERLYGGSEEGGEEIGQNRPQKLPLTPKTSATAQTMTPNTTPATTATTITISPTEPHTLTPSRHTESRERSLDDDSGDFPSADFEQTTMESSIQHMTTMYSSYYSRSSTTTKTPTGSQSFPEPPPVKPPPTESYFDSFSSGSGGHPDHRVTVTEGYSGMSESSASDVKNTKITVEMTMKTKVEPKQTVSVSKPMYTPSRTSERTTVIVSADQTTEQKSYSYEAVSWSRFTPSSSLAYTTAKTRLFPSTTFKPTASKGPLSTGQNTVDSHIRFSEQRNYGSNRSSTRSTPLAQSRGTKGSREEALTKLTAEPEYTSTQYISRGISNINASVFSNVRGNGTASFVHTTRLTASKPKIVGGNAASYTVLVNSDVFLPCEVVGHPNPNISWRRFSSTTGTDTE